MYVPPHARENRLDTLHDAIDTIRFGTLVTVDGSEPVMTHLPMLIERRPPLGRIVGHVARANPQWRAGPNSVAAATFVGPSFYVSPSWYASKAVHGKVVPTYNYIAVEARGHITFFEEAERLRALVDTLTHAFEGTRERPWSSGDAPPDFIASQLRGVVGFELTLSALVGAWKLNRNKDAADRDGVACGIAGSDDLCVRGLAETVRRGS